MLMKALETKRPLYRAIATRSKYSEDDFDDLYQQTLIKVWSKSDTYHNPGGGPEAWLMTIFKRTLIDQKRKDSRTPSTSLDSTEGDDLPLAGILIDSSLDADVEASVLQREVNEIVRACVGELSPVNRAIVEEVYLDEKTYNEVSQESNTPIGTVKSRANRARNTLGQMECLQELAEA
jgi:RNA polymerase sigma-70 factor (ECF subfamily)